MASSYAAPAYPGMMAGTPAAYAAPSWPVYPPAPMPQPPVPGAKKITIKDVIAHADLQKRKKEMPVDVLLNYSFLDKLNHKAKTAFVTLPKTIWRGLKGSSDYTFADSMLVAKFPYYLGGLFLTLSPFIGGDKREGIRQGAAMMMYLLGTAATHLYINTLYRMRYGVDLGMLYRSRTGQVEKVFSSSNFPRFDLLTPEHYRAMAKKMDIPGDIYEQDGAVREQLRHIITKSRALKLIVANLLSAVGAGYMARSDAWLEVPKVKPVLGAIWRNPKLNVLSKAGKSLSAIGVALSGPIAERLNVAKAPLWRKVVVLGGFGVLAATGLFILTMGAPSRQYRGGKLDLPEFQPQHRFNAGFMNPLQFVFQAQQGRGVV